MTELSKEQMRARGDKAAVLLRDPLFSEAAEAAEAALTATLMRTKAEDADRRELLYMECLGLRRVIKQLGAWADEAALIASEEK